MEAVWNNIMWKLCEGYVAMWRLCGLCGGYVGYVEAMWRLCGLCGGYVGYVEVMWLCGGYVAMWVMWRLEGYVVMWGVEGYVVMWGLEGYVVMWGYLYILISTIKIQFIHFTDHATFLPWFNGSAKMHK